MIDVLFITPNNSQKIYQKLSSNYSAVETPTWSLLLAESCRSKGYKVAILDTLAEQLTDDESYIRIKSLKPRLICFVVYGQNVNAGTTNMSGATRLSTFLKKKKIKCQISYIGSHVQALPRETLEKEESIDIVFLGEGVYSIWNLLSLNEITSSSISKVKGIAYKNDDKINFNNAEKIVSQIRMDIDLPGYAWDLLPYKKKPFDLYRSPMWHAEYKEENRTPYAAIQTSLGCQFKCNFCMINLINKDDESEIGISSNYSGMRFWSPEFIIKEFDKLINYGVRTVRIVDEMFLLNPKYYVPLCNLLKERNKKDDLRLWAYSRIDTVRRKNILELVRSAGIKWLCLGIESGDKKIRLEVAKGKFEDVDVQKVVKQVHDADIEIMANYIYGLPGDNEETIKKTFDLSVKLNTSGWNTYAAMALPGSLLYKDAIEKKVKLPDNYEGFSFHSYNTQPLPTKDLTAARILEIRDNSFIEYHNNEKFLNRIRNNFGEAAVKNIKEMVKIKLKRKIIDEKTL
jgi:anaerobic magnesium-protoporphyrin IX monomethyl ester cyclase